MKFFVGAKRRCDKRIDSLEDDCRLTKFACAIDERQNGIRSSTSGFDKHASPRGHTPAATWPAAVAASVATIQKRSIVHSVVHSDSKFNNKGNRTPR